MNDHGLPPPICMTLAGLDPSGGAGIVADIKTFFAFGCYPAAVIASITFQNTLGVYGAESMSGESVRSQAQPVIDDLGLDVLKTGMLPTREVIAATAALIRENEIEKVIVDPVVRSTSGFDLIDDAALRSSIAELFPLSTLLTPNIPEAERISGIAIEDEDDIMRAGEVILGFGVKALLIKGGHLGTAGSSAVAKDFLFINGELHTFEAPFIETKATHGTGCVLAAAIAANVALGRTLIDAVGIAKEFVHRAIETAEKIGKGNSPINVRPI